MFFKDSIYTLVSSGITSVYTSEGNDYSSLKIVQHGGVETHEPLLVLRLAIQVQASTAAVRSCQRAAFHSISPCPVVLTFFVPPFMMFLSLGGAGWELFVAENSHCLFSDL